MAETEEFKDRLRSTLQSQKITIAELQRRLGCSRQCIVNWLIGRNRPSYKIADSVAKALGVEKGWLLGGEQRVPAAERLPLERSGYVFVPEYTVGFSCGPGEEQPTWEAQADSKVAYRIEWFRDRHIRPELCRRVVAKGNSMEPTICEGDRVLLVEHRAGDPIIDDKIYAIGYGDQLRLKRLHRKANGDLVIRSDNPSYADETVTAADGVQIIIFGRAIERSGSLD